ncbi:hypothetical protein VNO77_19829 [Canavalia gladiata]|uniref:Uncharacterized protein n=1 Tax=Canavalia gladiata TaxID=3824 RepID=A0AAN9LNC0_CANGL
MEGVTDLGVSIDIPEEEWAWLHRCYIGVVANRTDVHEIHEELASDGITCLTPILMGGDQILLKPIGDEDIRYFFGSDVVDDKWGSSILETDEEELLLANIRELVP